MVILLFMELAAVAILFLLSKGKFKDEISLLEDKEDKLKFLLPIGFQIFCLFNHRYSTGYERRLEIKLHELASGKDSKTHLKLHMCRKVVIMMLALIFASFVGTQVAVDAAYVMFCLILLCSLFYITDKQLDDRIKQRRRSIQLEFPEFLSKLILLINAGLTVYGSIFKIVKDNRKENQLYKELAMAVNEINSGKSEIQAYEDFAKRCRLQEITMFASLLIQNLRKGNSELVPILRLQANTSWENRKNVAKKLGEEAATKLLIPMMLIFIAILIMIMTPAVMQINF